MAAEYYEGNMAAEFPSQAMDDMEERIDLNKMLMARPTDTFLVSCAGDSMINAFIPPKAMLVVDRSLTAENGDIVLARINGKFTVKFLKKNDRRCWLVPGNSKYREIEITPEMKMEVWGVVIKVIADTKDLRSCMH
ncbi:MAG: translesion error-prone DNA polymerase V autoproteolytic subunit [Flavitalea sp.]